MTTSNKEAWDCMKFIESHYPHRVWTVTQIEVLEHSLEAGLKCHCLGPKDSRQRSTYRAAGILEQFEKAVEFTLLLHS